MLPAVEIVTDGPYDYDARYNPGRTEYFAPARLNSELTESALSAALAIHTSLNLRHLSRVDMFVTEDGKLEFLEVNIAPGMTETSLFPQAVAAAGLDLGELYSELVEVAIGS